MGLVIAHTIEEHEKLDDHDHFMFFVKHTHCADRTLYGIVQAPNPANYAWLGQGASLTAVALYNGSEDSTLAAYLIDYMVHHGKICSLAALHCVKGGTAIWDILAEDSWGDPITGDMMDEEDFIRKTNYIEALRGNGKRGEWRVH